MSGPAVSTTSGRVSGAAVKGRAGFSVWLGIPYAAAPVGPLRFRAPRPAQRWQGTRECTTYGPASVQTISAVMKAGGRGYSEDCLTLNIWSPAADARRRPVLVWIHGGGFAAGSSSMFDGSQLAAEGDIIVVTLNYRLGIFGFVNLEHVEGESESNLGLRDQIAALEWVKANIAAFGGDPEQVTIAGESAGSVACALLLVCSRAHHLYKRAILQSGALNLVHDAETSRRVGERYARYLPVKKGLTALRDLRVDVLLQAQRAVDRSLPGLVPSAPWYDGELLPASYQAALESPIAPVPLLLGTCRDEIRLFEIIPGWKPLPTTNADLLLLLRSQIPALDVEVIRAAYPRTVEGNRAFATDALFGAGAWQLIARRPPDAPTWLYRFDATLPLFGALHGLDVTYIWKFNGPLAALVRGGLLLGDRRRLGERMRASWARFVRMGDPGADWPRVGASFATKLFDRHGLVDRVAVDPEPLRRAAWAGRALVPTLRRATEG